MIVDQNICITGGTGFIGSVLVGVLVDKNRVTVLDNLSRNALASYPYADHPNLTKVVGDVLDRDTVDRVVKDADYVIHCAGIAGISNVCRQPTATLKVNMVGSLNVLESAVAAGRAKRVVCFSTSEVFGGMAFTSQETDQTVIGAAGQARWTYAVSKLAEEHMAVAYHRDCGLPTAVVSPLQHLRPGPGRRGGAEKYSCSRPSRTSPSPSSARAPRSVPGVTWTTWWTAPFAAWRIRRPSASLSTSATPPVCRLSSAWPTP